MKEFESAKNRYHVIKEIGLDSDGQRIGSFGSVYKVRIPKDTLNKEYALKTIDLHKISRLYKKDIHVLRIRAERELAAGRIIHNNIVFNHDGGFSDRNKNNFFYVMDYYPDGSLFNFIDQAYRSGKFLPIEEIQNVALNILSGLKELHSQGFVHRDLKPENILRDGKRFALGDFGLCGYVVSRVTRHSDKIEGTRCYVAPQQYEEGKEKDIILPSTDIYAFGVIMYVLFTYMFPFGNDDYKISLLAKNNEWDDIHKHRPDVPPLWKNIIENCLQYKPEKRIQSVEEILSLIAPQDKTRKHNQIKANDKILFKIIYGNLPVKEYVINDIINKKNSNIITIGRNDFGVFNDIDLGSNDMYSSRIHATIERNLEKNCYTFVDGQCKGGIWLNSKNGSALNRKNISGNAPGTRHIIKDGDEMVMGETFCKIEKII